MYTVQRDRAERKHRSLHMLPSFRFEKTGQLHFELSGFLVLPASVDGVVRFPCCSFLRCVSSYCEWGELPCLEEIRHTERHAQWSDAWEKACGVFVRVLAGDPSETIYSERSVTTLDTGWEWAEERQVLSVILLVLGQAVSHLCSVGDCPLLSATARLVASWVSHFPWRLPRTGGGARQFVCFSNELPVVKTCASGFSAFGPR